MFFVFQFTIKNIKADQVKLKNVYIKNIILIIFHGNILYITIIIITFLITSGQIDYIDLFVLFWTYDDITDTHQNEIQYYIIIL